MNTFKTKDFTDQLSNYGYLEINLLPARTAGDNIEETIVIAHDTYTAFHATAMREMKPQFLDVLITDEKGVVNTKFSFSIFPLNSVTATSHMLRVQVDKNTLPMVDGFRGLPDEEIMSMFGHALGLMEPENEEI